MHAILAMIPVILLLIWDEYANNITTDYPGMCSWCSIEGREGGFHLFIIIWDWIRDCKKSDILEISILRLRVSVSCLVELHALFTLLSVAMKFRWSLHSVCIKSGGKVENEVIIRASDGIDSQKVCEKITHLALLLILTTSASINSVSLDLLQPEKGCQRHWYPFNWFRGSTHYPEKEVHDRDHEKHAQINQRDACHESSERFIWNKKVALLFPTKESWKMIFFLAILSFEEQALKNRWSSSVSAVSAVSVTILWSRRIMCSLDSCCERCIANTRQESAQGNS